MRRYTLFNFGRQCHLGLCPVVSDDDYSKEERLTGEGDDELDLAAACLERDGAVQHAADLEVRLAEQERQIERLRAQFATHCVQCPQCHAAIVPRESDPSRVTRAHDGARNDVTAGNPRGDGKSTPNSSRP